MLTAQCSQDTKRGKKQLIRPDKRFSETKVHLLMRAAGLCGDAADKASKHGARGGLVVHSRTRWKLRNPTFRNSVNA